mgnify:CR=1 FL=1
MKIGLLPPPSGWLKKWRIFGITLAVAYGCCVRKQKKGCSQKRAINGQRKAGILANAHNKKPRLYEAQQGQCFLCHREYKIKKMQIHHVLPLVLYPEYGSCIDNLILLCPECHQHIHWNPILNARLIQEKATEFGITDITTKFGSWLRNKTDN